MASLASGEISAPRNCSNILAASCSEDCRSVCLVDNTISGDGTLGVGGAWGPGKAAKAGYQGNPGIVRLSCQFFHAPAIELAKISATYTGTPLADRNDLIGGPRSGPLTQRKGQIAATALILTFWIVACRIHLELTAIFVASQASSLQRVHCAFVPAGPVCCVPMTVVGAVLLSVFVRGRTAGSATKGSLGCCTWGWLVVVLPTPQLGRLPPAAYVPLNRMPAVAAIAIMDFGR